MFDLACVIHVHTTYSDGTATVEEVVEAARQVGVQAVLITDHDTREAARQGCEGWHGGVLVLVGHEITTPRGHFLAFGIEREIDHRGLTEAEVCQQVKAQGGFGFAAHPFSQGGVVPSIIRPHPWPALEECEPFGIELWSLLTDAAERWRSPLAALRFLRNPVKVIDGPPTKSVAGWDALCQRRRVAAIGGLDAHQTGLRVGRVVLSSMRHRRYFKLLQTHVLLKERPRGQLQADREVVYNALREGRCYLAVEAYAPARGFSFEAVAPSRMAVQMGGRSELDGKLEVRVPRAGRISLFRDGHLVTQVNGRRLEHELTAAGAYRAEVTLDVHGRPRTWIISNPIYAKG